MDIYLDNSATTKPHKKVVESMLAAMENCYGNPSSLHEAGLRAEKLLKKARDDIRTSIGIQPDGRLVFTSGGTEANNMALICGARSKKRQGRTIVASPIEHPAVLEVCKYLTNEGFRTIFLDVDRDGKVVPDSLSSLINNDVILISCMCVNNETGVIQPIEALGQIKSAFERQRGKTVLFHVDEVQSFTKVRNEETPIKHVDMASYSAHKIHGPKGIGALYFKKSLNLQPYIFGGGQEEGFRSGTENIPAIAGFAQACSMAMIEPAARIEHVSVLKAGLLRGIQSEIEDIKINGSADAEQASPFILNVSFLGVKAEVLLHELEMQGILVSAGAACSSRKHVFSHVLKAMGLTDGEAEGAIRFSFCEMNTLEEIEKTVSVLKEAVKRFRKLGR